MEINEHLDRLEKKMDRILELLEIKDLSILKVEIHDSEYFRKKQGITGQEKIKGLCVGTTRSSSDAFENFKVQQNDNEF